MCGISGIIRLNSNTTPIDLKNIDNVTNLLSKRGPDAQGVFIDKNIALGHRRLSIIDTSKSANQPMTDIDDRYVIVFNGEFYNYKIHRESLEKKGIQFKTQSDTEVLLQLYIHYGAKCLEKINGFFAFAVYDKKLQSLFIARDRIGIKPLVYSFESNFFAFSSELKSLTELSINTKIDRASLFTYLQLNYIPAPYSIFKNVRKLEPGHYLFFEDINKISEKEKVTTCYYSISKQKANNPSNALNPTSYKTAQDTFTKLLNESVEMRMISDVPLGAFLSGGIDSSVVCAIASKYTKNLKTFSIGFKDHPFFDETHYAEEVANKFNTNHTTFKLTNQDLLEHIENALDYIDEPFADSSAINMYILSKKTKQKVQVALSGDGADELFAGYNKHEAEYRVNNLSKSKKAILSLTPLLKNLPKNRDNNIWNINRKLQRFSEGMKLSPGERYWKWATFRDEENANYLLKEKNIKPDLLASNVLLEYKKRKESILRHFGKSNDINTSLITDMQLVLPNDMLFKVDHMSMANSLEVRTPFLDHRLVNFAFQIPEEYKINPNIRKKIVQDSFKSILPKSLYNRPKKGFELPLKSWLKGELNYMISGDLFSKSFIQEQGIFNWAAIKQLQSKLMSNDVDGADETLWNLLVFQKWYTNYCQ